MSVAPVDGGVNVITKDAAGVESSVTFDHVITALPSPVLGRALGDSTTLAEATKALNSIPRASVAVINLGYRAPVLQSWNGFGYLIPSKEVPPLSLHRRSPIL